MTLSLCFQVSAPEDSEAAEDLPPGTDSVAVPFVLLATVLGILRDGTSCLPGLKFYPVNPECALLWVLLCCC